MTEKYYSYIQIDEQVYQNVNEQMIVFAQKKLGNNYYSLGDYSRSKHSHFLEVYGDEFFAACPKLKEYLDSQNLTLHLSTLISATEIHAHIDYTSEWHDTYKLPNGEFPKLVLLWPIHNCEHSEGFHYRFKDDYDGHVILGKSKTHVYRYSDLVQITDASYKFKPNHLIIIRTDVPHAVKHYDEKPRIVAALRFKEDPWNLI
jgi:hypothetical protein